MTTALIPTPERMHPSDEHVASHGEHHSPRPQHHDPDEAGYPPPPPRWDWFRLLFVALLGGLGFLAYATFVRDQLQVPLMATGFFVVGIVFAVMAITALLAVVRSGRDGHDGTAVVAALVGGVIAVGALMSLAGAVIMGLIWTGTQGA